MHRKSPNGDVAFTDSVLTLCCGDFVDGISK